MAGWTTHNGAAIALPLDNVDTDQLIPARFMSAPRSDGYGDFLLHDLRRDEAGTLKPNFPINADTAASILIAGANFGSGSSREAAVYALMDAGFKAIFAPSFGDIFSSNAVNNGLLPARIDAETCSKLLAQLAAGPCPAEINLVNSTATIGSHVISFALDHTWRTPLINGWDDVDVTQQHAETIAEFYDHYSTSAPWAFPSAPQQQRQSRTPASERCQHKKERY
jgi:3-isopropylmalate/(R)-2-methylmalate dehydratase small subunit